MQVLQQERPASQRVLPALAEVYHLHQDMQKTINQMDVKIEEVIRSHEAEFLLAYRNHIKRIKLELAEIKNKSQEQEKKMMSNDRSVILQKQIILFREEALRLYDKLDSLSQQHQMTKTRCRELQKTNDILERQNMDQARQIKILQTEKTLLQSQIETLTLDTQQLKDELTLSKEKGKIKPSQGLTSNTNTHYQQESKKIKTPKAKESFQLPLHLNTRKTTLQPERRKEFVSSKKNSFLKQRSSISKEILDHELKSYFVECLETIRREVGQRKVYGFKTQDIGSIASWQEFRMIDKLRLLQMFMQNEKLLVWMYQRIFPTRLNQLQHYFSKKKDAQGESRQKSKSMSIQLGDMDLTGEMVVQPVSQELNLPRVMGRGKKDKKYDVRGRIELKNGKLNLIQNNDEHD